MTTSVRRSILACAALAALVLPMARASAAPTEAERTAETKLLKIINRAREAQDLRPVREHDTILEEARAQSERMAEAGELNHAGLEARKNRIAREDDGIDPDQICEAVAQAPVGNVAKQMKKIFKAWRAAEAQRDCLLDGLGFTSRSAAVGVIIADNSYWVTYIGASDSTRGRN